MTKAISAPQELLEAEVTAIITIMTDHEAPFAAEAIDSVLNQTVPVNVIVVVRDNNSWIDNIVGDKPVLIHRIGPAYSGNARNQGSALATTDYLAYLDGDDFWHPSKTEKQLKIAKATDADLVGTDHLLVDEMGRPFARSLSRYLAMTSSWLMRRRVWQARHFSNTLPRGDDGDWWVRNVKDLKVERLPESLLLYRVRSSSQSSQSDSKKRKLQLRQFSEAGFRQLVMGVSALLSRLYKSNKYLWHSNWDKQ